VDIYSDKVVITFNSLYWILRTLYVVVSIDREKLSILCIGFPR